MEQQTWIKLFQSSWAAFPSSVDGGPVVSRGFRESLRALAGLLRKGSRTAAVEAGKHWIESY